MKVAAIAALALVLSLRAEVTHPPLGLDLYMPVPDSNPLTAEKIDFGRRLFNDRRLSRDGSITCASCHDPTRAFSDGRALAVGIEGRVGRRNAPAIINRGYGRTFFWDGRAISLEDQVLRPIEDQNEMDQPITEAAVRVGVPVDEISRALASYVRSILSGNSAYDRYVNGDRDALSADAQAGLQIFRGKGHCTACHIGPTLTDEQFHNTGIAWRDGRIADDGRFAVSKEERDHGAFKTPTLRDVAQTAPYMHDGSLATLEDVIEFYDRGGNRNPFLDSELRPLSLTSDERRALQAFLLALTGDHRSGSGMR